MCNALDSVKEDERGSIPEEREKKITHHSQLHSEFKASPGNTRPCLKIVCMFLTIKIQKERRKISKQCLKTNFLFHDSLSNY